MTLEFIFLRFWRLISLPLLVAMTLIFHITLPDMVAYHHTDLGQPDGFVDKQQFFYYTAGIFLVLNILIRFLGNNLSKALHGILPESSVWKQTPEATAHLGEAAANALAGALNTFMFLCLVALSQINADKDQILRANYNWLLLIGGVLIVGAFFYLPLRLLYGKPDGLETRNEI